MPSKKKRYNARFPPARIKKIMQTDEDVGKVAAAVPVIISRALELFIESLILKANETTQSRQAKTLSTAHIKQTIMAEKEFDFLRDLVASVPDHQTEEDGEANNIPETKKTRVPRSRKSKAEAAGPSRRGDRKTSSDSSHLEVDEEDDEETESEDELDHMKNTSTQENHHLENTSGQESDHQRNVSSHENDSWGNTSSRDVDRLGNSSAPEDEQCGNSSGLENNRLRNLSVEGDSVHSVTSSVNNSYNSSQSRGNGDDSCRQIPFSSPNDKNDRTDSFYPSHVNAASSPLAASLSAPPFIPGVPPFKSAGVVPLPIPQIGTCNPRMPNSAYPVFSGPPQPGQGPYPIPFLNHSATGAMPPMYIPPTMFSNLQMHKPSQNEDDDYDA